MVPIAEIGLSGGTQMMAMASSNEVRACVLACVWAGGCGGRVTW